MPDFQKRIWSFIEEIGCMQQHRKAYFRNERIHPLYFSLHFGLIACSNPEEGRPVLHQTLCRYIGFKTVSLSFQKGLSELDWALHTEGSAAV